MFTRKIFFDFLIETLLKLKEKVEKFPQIEMQYVNFFKEAFEKIDDIEREKDRTETLSTDLAVKIDEEKKSFNICEHFRVLGEFTDQLKKADEELKSMKKLADRKKKREENRLKREEQERSKLIKMK